MWNTGLLVMLGVWMVIVPLVVPDATPHAWNNRIVGLLAICLALASPQAYRWEVFAAAAVGVWLIASPVVPALRLSGYLVWNDVASGILLIVTGARATMKTPERAAPKFPP